MNAVIDRLVQYPNRFQLTNISDGTVLGTFDLSPVTGTVSVVGTILNHDLFQSIADDLASRIKTEGGVVSNTIETFTMAGTRTNISSGETISVSFGKIAKIINDLKAVAFSGNKADIGLGNVDNTSDASKPVSNATEIELNKKVDKVAGSSLMTDAEHNKLSGIADGAEVNVNADWNATSGDAVILNKPIIPTVPVQSVNSKTGAVVLTGSDIATSSADSEKLDSKSVANMLHLGAYDTYTYADESYTITRQTGYLKLDGVENKFNSKTGSTNNGEYSYNGVINYISKPSTPSAIADIISDTLKTLTADTLFAHNTYGIATDTLGSILVGLTTAIDTLDKANDYLKQNPISIQYMLATSTTERVEKNHFARTGQPYIEEWKKSEADRSSNLCNTFDRSNIPSDSSLYSATLNPDGTYTSTATSDGREWSYSNSDFKLELEPGTYTVSARLTSDNPNVGIKLFDSNNNELADASASPRVFTLTSRTSVGIMVKAFDGSAYIMLNRGSVAIPYQPYEGEVVHGKGLAETLSAYPTSQKVSETYLAKSDATSTYVAKSSLTSGSIAIDTTTNSDFCQFAYNHPNAIWSYSTATSTPPPNITYHNYPALIYAKKVWVGIAKAYSYNARVFYFDPDKKAYMEITSGTLKYSIAS